MKTIITFIILLQIGCNTKDDFTKRVILKNNVGTISLSNLNNFDSYQESVKLSDCGCCCREYWYTFKNSKYDNYPYSDTINYFVDYDYRTLEKHSLTISQPTCKYCLTDDSLIEIKDEDRLLHLKQRMKLFVEEHYKTRFLDTSIVDDGNNVLSIISYREIWFDKRIKETLEAFTVINNEPVQFNFERIGNDSTDFIQNAKEILKTLRINEE